MKNNVKNTNILQNIGVEQKGLVSGDYDMGEDEFKENLGSPKAASMNSKNNGLVAPSKPNVQPPSKNMEKEAEEITSLVAPITPPNSNSDMESSGDESSGDELYSESISNKLAPEQKVGGGRGGSLYSAMARTTYTLAPAAALLATAAMVIKGNKRTRKHTRRHVKKSRKIVKRYRK
jgi:hypothetical protein